MPFHSCLAAAVWEKKFRLANFDVIPSSALPSLPMLSASVNLHTLEVQILERIRIHTHVYTMQATRTTVYAHKV